MNNADNKLDEISRSIGNLEAAAKEFRAGAIAITELIKANEKLSCERDEALKKDVYREIGEHKSSAEQLDRRVSALEKEKAHRDSVVSVFTWFARNWPNALLLSILAGIVAWVNGKI